MTINKDQIAQYLERTRAKFEELNDVDITLVFNNSFFFTMISILDLRNVFGKKRKYLIVINQKRTKVLINLSSINYIGWFAHELSHIVEYEKMTNTELFKFTLKYLLDRKFRFSVEKKVTIIAIKKGFTLELLYTWRAFMKFEAISPSYKNYIAQNYLPKWVDIETEALSSGISKNEYDELTGI